MASSVLVLGAGRSSSSLIAYLLDAAAAHHFSVTVGDVSIAAAREKTGDRGHAIHFDIEEVAASAEVIQSADIVISMLPPHFHVAVARLCLAYRKHLITASYVSDEMKSLHDEAKEKDLLFLNESGLDPGIDHMSAMQVIDQIRDSGGVLDSFESFTGGLIAPETDPKNPWRYKFTWNPRNVVMAGQGTAKFLQDGKFKYVPYQQLFKRLTQVVVPGFGAYEGYVNRDSLKYRSAYGLENISTMIRGTLRNKGYCGAWDVLVQLGCTDDTYQMEGVDSMSHNEFINSFLDADGIAEEKIKEKLALNINGPELERLRWSGFFTEEKVGRQTGTPAQILETILQKKWKLQPADKDLVVMWHRFVYQQQGRKHEIQSSLVVTGEDAVQTAMAKTVGLPLGIAAKLLLAGKIKTRGVVIPVIKEIYEPIMAELKTLGVALAERKIN